MSSCTLTPQARAFSSILSAVIGSMINGVSAGSDVAMMTALISFNPFFRVIIIGLYMLYRSITGTWTIEAGVEEFEYEILHKESYMDRFLVRLGLLPSFESLDQDANSPLSERALSGPYRGIEMSSAALTELAGVSTGNDDFYHCCVYTSVFGYGGPAIVRNPKRSTFQVFWPTRSYLAACRQILQYAQQKRGELLRYYSSEDKLARAIARYTQLFKLGKLPGPDTNLASWQILNCEVTWLGWVGWVYGAVYAPVSQIIWMAADSSSKIPSGKVRIVKSLSIAVTALPLGIDTRVRFAESLQTARFGGNWAYRVFNLTNAGSYLL
ncbi:hypothetical protein VTL71DRAFT_15785 [Oculimacula yallundae]|uniref:Uncharacterized protein n=1 Tax=Oculimacula yallundae TaxID=86028 RepID=A0ABR4CCL4_9HELO